MQVASVEEAIALEAIRRIKADRAPVPVRLDAPDDWQEWLRYYFAPYVSSASGDLVPFAERHERFWQWIWALSRGQRAQPFIAVWPRGGAKSTSVELGVVVAAARDSRRYGLYVCETQDQADTHVQNIASMLEREAFAVDYPDVAKRLVGKYGNSQGWRRNRLRTSSGFTLDAIGLDTAARGAKVDEDRPDLIIFDDLDSEVDSPVAVEKKITTLTRKILPAGSNDMTVLGVQNLVHPDSIFSRLVDGRADFLSDRYISGPFPALEHMEYEQRDGRYVITAGEPTWEGQDLARCQQMVADFGWSSFLAECQHQVDAPPGGMFSHLDFQHCTRGDLPELVRTVCWVDPAVTNKDDSDSQGIQIDGLGVDNRIYRLFSWEDRTSPLDAIERAITKAIEWKAEKVGIETDQGGDTWESVYREATRNLGVEATAPRMDSDKAGAGYGPKVHRASQMLPDYETGMIVHMWGTHATLERGLKRFPKTKPYDLTDASWWCWRDLRGSSPVAYAAAPSVERWRPGRRMGGWS